MAKVDDPTTPGWDDPPLPLGSRQEEGPRPQTRRLSLLHLMIGILFFAILFWAGKLALESQGYFEAILVGVAIGGGLCGLGLWLVASLSRASFVGWIFFVVGYFIVSLATSGFLSLGSLLVLIGAIIFINYRRHANNQDALLWVLEVAAERGIPLGPGIHAFSGQVSGMYQVWTASLSDLIRRGVPLPDALDSIPRLVPRRSALMIRMGWESGSLALGLKEAGAIRESRQPVLHAIGGRLAYLAWISTIAFSIVGFVMYFIIPKFEAIFKDFGVRLPSVTILVIKASHFAVDYAYIPMLLFLGLGVRGFMTVLGPGDMTIPLLDRFFARRHVTTILRSLAIVVSANRPIPPALFALSQWYPAAWVRKRLNQAALDASLGHPWTTALRENGLLSSSDVGVLTSAERAGNLAWALRELAETGERRWGYRLQAWTQILFVVAMLIFGTLIFFLAVAFFLPLITLIERLA